LPLPARPLRSQYSCRNAALRLPGLHLLSAPSLQIIAKASVSQIKTALRSTTLSAGLLCYFLAVMLFIRNKPVSLRAHYRGIPFIPFQLTWRHFYAACRQFFAVGKSLVKFICIIIAL